MAVIKNEVRYTGDDWDFPMTLSAGGVPRTDLTGSIITVAVVNSEAVMLIPTVTLTEDAGWVTGDIVASFERSTTSVNQYGTLFVEVQVEIAGKRITHGRMPFTSQKGSLP